jgi:hypothetical protein
MFSSLIVKVKLELEEK